MGYIHAEEVEIHVSKSDRLMLKYEFVNKNGEHDFMYIGLSNHVIDELKSLRELGYNYDRK